MALDCSTAGLQRVCQVMEAGGFLLSITATARVLPRSIFLVGSSGLSARLSLTPRCTLAVQVNMQLCRSMLIALVLTVALQSAAANEWIVETGSFFIRQPASIAGSEEAAIGDVSAFLLPACRCLVHILAAYTAQCALTG